MPSGKDLQYYGKSPFSTNQLFLWPFSSSYVNLPEGKKSIPKVTISTVCIRGFPSALSGTYELARGVGCFFDQLAKHFLGFLIETIQ